MDVVISLGAVGSTVVQVNRIEEQEDNGAPLPPNGNHMEAAPPPYNENDSLPPK